MVDFPTPMFPSKEMRAGFDAPDKKSLPSLPSIPLLPAPSFVVGKGSKYCSSALNSLLFFDAISMTIFKESATELRYEKQHPRPVRAKASTTAHSITAHGINIA